MSPRHTSAQVLFLDIETTGLNPRFASILEVAAVVVDAHLSQHASFERTIFHDSTTVGAEMDDWCTRTHTNSGLLEEVDRSPHTLKDTDEALANFIAKEMGEDNKVELAGNSVHFDLGFLVHHMPRTAALLSHRVCDVSGAARMLRRFTRVDPGSTGGAVAHRAMADVQQSIAQLLLIKKAVNGGSRAA